MQGYNNSISANYCMDTERQLLYNINNNRESQKLEEKSRPIAFYNKLRG